VILSDSDTDGKAFNDTLIIYLQEVDIPLVNLMEIATEMKAEADLVIILYNSHYLT